MLYRCTLKFSWYEHLTVEANSKEEAEKKATLMVKTTHLEYVEAKNTREKVTANEHDN